MNPARRLLRNKNPGRARLESPATAGVVRAICVKPWRFRPRRAVMLL
jgi:hypothetical protein